MKGWPSLKVTPLLFIELFGENLYAHQVSKAARNLPLVTQHLVLCLAPNPGTGIGSPPFAVVLEPTVDVPTMAPLYLGSDLTPKPQFVVLPEFPDNRPNMLCSGMNIRIPLFDKANPLLFRGIDNDWQPFPLYYSPSQVELAALPPHIYRNYISAVMKYKVLKLQSVICRWCQTRVGLDMFTPQIRSKIRGKPCDGCRPSRNGLEEPPAPGPRFSKSLPVAVSLHTLKGGSSLRRPLSSRSDIASLVLGTRRLRGRLRGGWSGRAQPSRVWVHPSLLQEVSTGGHDLQHHPMSAERKPPQGSQEAFSFRMGSCPSTPSLA